MSPYTVLYHASRVLKPLFLAIISGIDSRCTLKIACNQMLFLSSPAINLITPPPLPPSIFNVGRHCFRSSLTAMQIFAGGSTMLPGLGERLHKEISNLVNPRDPGRVKVVSPDDRKYAVWSGSAVLAGLSTFPQMCISVQEYDEMGPDIVHRKCF